MEAAKTWERTWAGFVICIFCATILAKLTGLLIATPILNETDSVTGLTNRSAVILSAIAECFIVGLLVSPLRTTFLVRVLPGLFGLIGLLYRIKADSLGSHTCPCLGGLFGKNRIVMEYQNNFLTAAALFLVISYPISQLALRKVYGEPHS